MLAAVWGDSTRLVLARLDPVFGWQTLATVVQFDGSLSALLPGPGTVAIMRLADTAWVQTLTDAPLQADPLSEATTSVSGGMRLELVGEAEGLLHVRTPDGLLAWMPSTLAGPVPAPDAAPPIPVANSTPVAPAATSAPDTAGVQVSAAAEPPSEDEAPLRDA
jgi:hypothetical protein